MNFPYFNQFCIIMSNTNFLSLTSCLVIFATLIRPRTYQKNSVITLRVNFTNLTCSVFINGEKYNFHLTSKD